MTAVSRPQRRQNNLPAARLSCILLWALSLAVAGCRSAPRTYTVDRPQRHTVRGDQFVVHSNFRIPQDSPIVQELNSLRREIRETLKLPDQRDPVVVYLFDDEASYRRYLYTTWPELPPRRAYFVGTSRELGVYSFRSPRIQEDLRHEFTHGLLHASLNEVPLWLDEGLAEYFEVSGPSPGTPHPEHVQHLRSARANGWQPSMYNLENLVDFKAMTQSDYAESWGWVHYMLHSDDAVRTEFLNYLQHLRVAENPPRLLPRLAKVAPNLQQSIAQHLTTVAGAVSLANYETTSGE